MTGTYCARAQVQRTERVIISVEMRPPKRGELGWCVPMDADVTLALLHVIAERGSWNEGECGYGVHATVDWPELSRSGSDRHITVVLTWESVETGTVVLL